MRRALAFVIALALGGCTTVTAPPAAPASAPPPHHVWAAFDSQRILASGAAGLADRGSGRALTIDDPVRIASVSKLVVALGVMRLVEEGKLDLDGDVSDILGWRLANPAFPNDKVTLRRLLSHRSSLRDGIDYALPLGASLKDSLANPAAFDAEHRPGGFFRYSNLNFPVVATVMEKATGERFDRLMQRLVLTPLGLSACFNWTTCRPEAPKRAVVLYAGDGSVLRDDLKGAPPPCPVVPAADRSCDLSGYVPGTNGALFSPQGGLRISARDLAIVGRLLLNRGMKDGRRFLSEGSIAAMLSPQWRFDGTNGDTEGGFYCAYGLAIQILPNSRPGCSDDLLGDGTVLRGHAGDAYGVRSGLWIDERRRRGMAYFAVAQGDDAAKGRTAFRAAEEWLARKARR
jgi:CubicO group peptidase (beta-lactamase class C family)